MKTTAYNTQRRAEPRWRLRHQLRQAELPGALTGWLFDSGSLTRRLRQSCSSRFRLEVLGQSLEQPLPSEARRLGGLPHVYVWVREVRLLCGDTPWVFARTVIPRANLRGGCQRLTQLGSRPLGEILFSDPQVRRGQVEVAPLSWGHWLYDRALGHDAEVGTTIWGRRSTFFVDGKMLLVCEIFLPGLALGGFVEGQ